MGGGRKTKKSGAPSTPTKEAGARVAGKSSAPTHPKHSSPHAGKDKGGSCPTSPARGGAAHETASASTPAGGKGTPKPPTSPSKDSSAVVPGQAGRTPEQVRVSTASKPSPVQETTQAASPDLEVDDESYDDEEAAAPAVAVTATRGAEPVTGTAQHAAGTDVVADNANVGGDAREARRNNKNLIEARILMSGEPPAEVSQLPAGGTDGTTGTGGTPAQVRGAPGDVPTQDDYVGHGYTATDAAASKKGPGPWTAPPRRAAVPVAASQPVAGPAHQVRIPQRAEGNQTPVELRFELTEAHKEIKWLRDAYHQLVQHQPLSVQEAPTQVHLPVPRSQPAVTATAAGPSAAAVVPTGTTHQHVLHTKQEYGMVPWFTESPAPWKIYKEFQTWQLHRFAMHHSNPQHYARPHGFLACIPHKELQEYLNTGLYKREDGATIHLEHFTEADAQRLYSNACPKEPQRVTDTLIDCVWPTDNPQLPNAVVKLITAINKAISDDRAFHNYLFAEGANHKLVIDYIMTNLIGHQPLYDRLRIELDKKGPAHNNWGPFRDLLHQMSHDLAIQYPNIAQNWKTEVTQRSSHTGSRGNPSHSARGAPPQPSGRGGSFQGRGRGSKRAARSLNRGSSAGPSNPAPSNSHRFNYTQYPKAGLLAGMRLNRDDPSSHSVYWKHVHPQLARNHMPYCIGKANKCPPETRHYWLDCPNRGDQQATMLRWREWVADILARSEVRWEKENDGKNKRARHYITSPHDSINIVAPLPPSVKVRTSTLSMGKPAGPAKPKGFLKVCKTSSPVARVNWAQCLAPSVAAPTGSPDAKVVDIPSRLRFTDAPLFCIADTGAEVNLIGPSHLVDLAKAGVPFTRHPTDAPLQLAGPFGSGHTTSSCTVVLPRLAITTSNGSVSFTNVSFYLVSTAKEIILGLPFTEAAGFSIRKHLTTHQTTLDGMDMEDVALTTEGTIRRLSSMQDAASYVPLQLEAHAPLDDADPLEQDAPGLTIGKVDQLEEDRYFEGMVQRTLDAVEEYRQDPHLCNQIPVDADARIESIIRKHRSAFSTKLTGRPACAIPPMRIELKPGARASNCKPRRHPPAKQAFIANTCAGLTAEKLVRPVKSADWVASPLLVPKPPPALWRMTIDLRPINHATVKDERPMPNMDTMLLDVAGSLYFGEADLVHAFFQVLLDLRDRHYHTFRGADSHSLHEPGRTLQGAKNSGIHLQCGAPELLQPINRNLLIWLDDWLLHAKTFIEYLTVLEKFLALCVEHNFVLSPAKCKLLCKQAKWCGRKISAEGITLDPRRIDGLLSMQRPETAGDLQQFICAVNWMRSGIPNYTTAIGKLQALLLTLTAKHGAKKSRLAKVVLGTDLWTPDMQAEFDHIKTLILKRVELTHFDPAQRLCLHTDASDHYWAGVLTQIPLEDLDKPQGEQRHAPLAFISGAFTGALSRWSTLEKEAFAIVNCMARLDYITTCAHTNIYTDHRKLIFIFDPTRFQTTMPAYLVSYLVSKIQRWALILSQFEYSCSHVPGEFNYWADLMTRWGAKSIRRVCLPTPAASLVDFNPVSFYKELVAEQAKLSTTERQKLTETVAHGHTILSKDGKHFVPQQSDKLKLALLVMAHSGSGGHRAQHVTKTTVHQFFTWKGMDDDVKTFCNKCLHCSATKGTIRVTRELAHAMHADRPNEIVHFDYLYMGAGKGGAKYVLILKDDFSNYVWLRPASTCDAAHAIKALTEWVAAFGIPSVWISDQGSHFKNEVMHQLANELNTHHHFTTAYHPESNGTVEVVCRETLRVARALLSEFQLGAAEWPRFLNTIQRVLNHSPSPKLGSNYAPITAFTTQPPDSTLHFLTEEIGDIQGMKTLPLIQARQLLHLHTLQEAMESMHKSVTLAASKARAGAVARHNAKTNVHTVNFSPGDYVLVGCPQPHKQNKLAVTWTGPARVMKLISPLVAQIQDIATGRIKEVHASRLKFYNDTLMNVTQELKEYLKYQNATLYLVDQLKELAKTRRTGFKVLVSWVGFPGEDTWEPLRDLYQDVPIRVRGFINSILDSNPGAAAALATLPQDC